MKLGELASVFRSKNAEPFLTTIDVLFDDRTVYEWVAESGAVNADAVSNAYRIPKEAVYGVFFVPSINAIKISIIKFSEENGYYGSGDPVCVDHFGAQQHVPLLDLDVPAMPGKVR